MERNYFQDWPLEHSIMWKATDDVNDKTLPTLEELIDITWKPNDLADIVNYLASGKFHSMMISSEVVVCDLCHSFYFSPCIRRSDGTWNWPEYLPHLVAVHSVRIPDLFVEHIRKKIASPT
jgi:hypothetical protein